MRGTVTRLEGKYAHVRIIREEMCGECHACDMMGEQKKCEIKCLNKVQVQFGDLVEVDGSSDQFLKATGLMYGLPLVGLLGGLGVGYMLSVMFMGSEKEWLMLVLGLAGMTGMFLWVRKRDAQRKYERFLPSITKVIKN
ncbi:MAG: SoxR reducing system RseC family protein [Cellulosilyticaceae bacterium]